MIIKQGRKFPLMHYKETQCTNEWCSLLGSGKEQTTSLVSIYFFNFSVLGDRQKYAYIILFFHFKYSSLFMSVCSCRVQSTTLSMHWHHIHEPLMPH